MRRLFLMLGLVAMVAGVAHAGTLVTNDGSFASPNGCTGTPAPIPTPLTINTLTQVIPAPLLPGQATHICNITYGVQSIVNNIGVFFSYGTGVNCGTTNTVFESSTLFDGSSTTAGEFISPWAAYLYTAPANTAICVLQSGASGTLVNTGTIKYAVFSALLALLLVLPSSANAGTLVTNDGSFVGAGQCPLSVNTPNLAVGTVTQVIAAPANPNQAIHICQWTYGVQNLTAALGVFMSDGGGTNCATNNTPLDSATMFAGASFTSGVFLSPYAAYYLTAPTGTAVCLQQAGTTGTQFYVGSIKYAIF